MTCVFRDAKCNCKCKVIYLPKCGVEKHGYLCHSHGQSLGDGHPVCSFDRHLKNGTHSSPKLPHIHPKRGLVSALRSASSGLAEEPSVVIHSWACTPHWSNVWLQIYDPIIENIFVLWHNLSVPACSFGAALHCTGLVKIKTCNRHNYHFWLKGKTLKTLAKVHSLNWEKETCTNC